MTMMMMNLSHPEPTETGFHLVSVCQSNSTVPSAACSQSWPRHRTEILTLTQILHSVPKNSTVLRYHDNPNYKILWVTDTLYTNFVIMTLSEVCVSGSDEVSPGRLHGLGSSSARGLLHEYFYPVTIQTDGAVAVLFLLFPLSRLHVFSEMFLD